ncbi:PQQ-dependent sugar dehydrogenase [Massilia arenae]|uniref:Sorbosone dehydrogenase family protein n=1 Tax=Massilia arenae TaxID=2603288 RepID=A0A5C7G790_9BURK|nr:sorbosone dehydrogenase family protein [Massilia arenae]TXG01908.1 sorbosone dehydrogenase family protein [Massilia arenae]
MRKPLPFMCAGAAMLLLAACGDKSTLPAGADMGSQPTLKEPNRTLIPTVHIAPAKSWPANMTPTPAPGLAVNAFGTALDHPRWIYVLPNGDVLVAETNAPQRPAKKGIGDWVTGKVMARAGAGVPSANRISLLRDADGDGVAEMKSVFLKDLNSPFGMALVGDVLYVANTDAVVRFPYKEGVTEILDKPQRVAPLPGGPLNHHWTKNIIASKDGSKLYATTGSNSNVAENGMDQEQDRAAILEIDVASGKTRVFASGLRNPNGMAWHPETGVLWTVVNERDLIGSDLVPDYLTSVKDGGFYGWPYSYFGKNVDTRVEPPRPDLVEKAIVPDYALGAHVAALGLAFYEGSLLPAQFRHGAIIGNHGSWNRKPRSGYNVVFVPFKDGRPNGKPVDMLTGFVNKDGEAHGRPVGVAVDHKGAVLVADDVGNVIWRVVPDAG